MATSIIISSTHEETRMGLLEDKVLREYLVERDSENHLVGNIFLGRVANVVPGLQAAFVDIGLEQNAFLFVGDDRRLTEGRSVLVQISKDPRGAKGPTATREVTLPGRYIVLVPGNDYIGISRKINGALKREHLWELIEKNKPKNMGVVVRTVADGLPDEVLLSDLKTQLAAWQHIEKRMRVSKAPVLVYRELDLSVRIVRDYLNSSVEKIIIDDKDAYERLLNLLKGVPDEDIKKLKLYRGAQDIFSYYGLTEAIASISDRRVDLPCGGYIVIDHTEAMTVIDVNSGSFKDPSSLEATIMRTNREAAEAIAFQLRLRDIGGIIVVDFIDMHTEAHKNEVLQVLQKAFAGDKMRPKIQDITVLNLVEITRKKSRQNLDSVLYAPCPVCQGSGQVQSPETVAIEAKRRLRGLLKKPGACRDILIMAHPLVAEYLKTQLHAWDRELNCSLTVEEDAALDVESFSLLDNS